jgi:transposase
MTAPAFAFWTQLLDLPDYEVVYCQKEGDLHCYRFTLTPTHRLGVCPHCGKIADTIHQTRSQDHIKDLSIGTESVELTVRVLQFECACGRHFTPPMSMTGK